MQVINKAIKLSVAILLSAALGSNVCFAGKPAGGGGGGKVSVEAAYPNEAAQGQEVDVIVSGSGFDAGSQVSYLVTGTTDASQVEVLSVEYVSDTELKTPNSPKGRSAGHRL